MNSVRVVVKSISDLLMFPAEKSRCNVSVDIATFSRFIIDSVSLVAFLSKCLVLLSHSEICQECTALPSIRVVAYIWRFSFPCLRFSSIFVLLSSKSHLPLLPTKFDLFKDSKSHVAVCILKRNTFPS